MGKYKVGDRVRIVSKRGIGWNRAGEMDKWCGKVMTIRECDGCTLYYMKEDRKENFGYGWLWCDSDIVGIADDTPKPTKPVGFTKDDLRENDFILKRNGTVEMIILHEDVRLCTKGWNDLNSINHDLTSSINKDFDIVAVRRPTDRADYRFDIFDLKLGKLVYKRKSNKKV